MTLESRDPPPRMLANDSAAAESGMANRCRNCGFAAPHRYCPNCGQETDLALPTAGAFLRDAAGRYIRFDGRMWRSLHALLFRPGFLTREYLVGRRRRYVRPARLFVALSIVLFAVLRFTTGAPVIVDAPAQAARDKETIVEGAATGAADFGVRVDPALNLSLDVGNSPRLAPLRHRVEAFNRLPRQEKADQLIAGVLRYAPYAAIGLLPLFALLLEVVYADGKRRHPGRPRRYAAHLVFGAHNHAFVFLAATVMALVDFGPLRAMLAAWMIVYASFRCGVSTAAAGPASLFALP